MVDNYRNFSDEILKICDKILELNVYDNVKAEVKRYIEFVREVRDLPFDNELFDKIIVIFRKKIKKALHVDNYFSKPVFFMSQIRDFLKCSLEYFENFLRAKNPTEETVKIYDLYCKVEFDGNVPCMDAMVDKIADLRYSVREILSNEIKFDPDLTINKIKESPIFIDIKNKFKVTIDKYTESEYSKFILLNDMRNIFKEFICITYSFACGKKETREKEINEIYNKSNFITFLYAIDFFSYNSIHGIEDDFSVEELMENTDIPINFDDKLKKEEIERFCCDDYLTSGGKKSGLYINIFLSSLLIFLIVFIIRNKIEYSYIKNIISGNV